jgi:hypothetical protein
VGRDQHDAERLGREHHRHVDVARQMRQPLGVSRIRKPGEVERVLVSWSGDDRVNLALHRKLDRGLDRVTRQATGSYGTSPILTPLTRPLAPAADRQTLPDGELGELVFRPHQSEVRIQRLGQCAGDDLRTDASRIAQRDRQSRTRATSS